MSTRKTIETIVVEVYNDNTATIRRKNTVHEIDRDTVLKNVNLSIPKTDFEIKISCKRK